MEQPTEPDPVQQVVELQDAEEPQQGEALNNHGESNGAVDAEQPTEEPKKKKKRSKGGKGPAKRGPTALPASRGCGFEEYYADPPLTPQEAIEELEELYAPSVSFEERMQSCIQRFRSRRRLQADLTLYFDEYLFLGGVDSKPGYFSGHDPRELKELTPAQRRDITAKDFIHGGSASDRFYNGDRDDWSVDFAGVAAGFLSVTAPQLTGLQGVDRAVAVVENFLRYVLHHEVCPEYAENVKRALGVCADAREEWPVLQKLRMAMPGEFHFAATELFCTGDEEDVWSRHGFPRPAEFDAKSVFYSAIALLDDRDRFARLCEEKPQITREVNCVVQFIDIIRPSEAIVQRFRSLTVDGEPTTNQPLGTATCRQSTIEDGWAHPVLPTQLAEDEEITLYLDDAILARLKPGMKMDLTLCELGGGAQGIWFVKTAGMLVPSFYTFLPQELMRHYKPPRENERPARSVHDPDADEEQLAMEAEKA